MLDRRAGEGDMTGDFDGLGFLGTVAALVQAYGPH